MDTKIFWDINEANHMVKNHFMKEYAACYVDGGEGVKHKHTCNPLNSLVGVTF
jgi:hypothetical protein